ncbi:MAG: ribonuclease PH [Deltaproteobacteria bacterium]|jgi:ribonuclease PH|nr:ribonuclease PH [Deltaproteobacteria bacterium]MBW2534251.1 ribonuclease PH [Deltaproteobacteria bacterium]
MSRPSGRTAEQYRPVEMSAGFHRNAEGSVLYRAGGTVVLCTASVADEVPRWMADEGRGWITAEYQMHPRANPSQRERREGRGKPPKGRTMEIQRLVGRALRAALDLGALGPRTVTVDCDVLEADGGTRTASVTGGFVAMVLALHRVAQRTPFVAPPLRDWVAAISVGLLGDEIAVDLDYAEDSTARVDMNVVATRAGRLVELQATAEGEPMERAQADAMLDAALRAIASLADLQRSVLVDASVDLAKLGTSQVVGAA